MSRDVFSDFFRAARLSRSASDRCAPPKRLRDDRPVRVKPTDAPPKKKKVPEPTTDDWSDAAEDALNVSSSSLEELDAEEDHEADGPIFVRTGKKKVLEFGEEGEDGNELRGEIAEIIRAETLRGGESSSIEETSPVKEEDGVRSIFVGNLPRGTSQMDVRNYFERMVGKTAACRVLVQDREKHGRTAVAFVDFDVYSMAAKAVRKCHGKDVGGKRIQVRLARDRPAESNRVGGTGIYVRNISFEASEQELRELFQPCGNILQLRLPVFQDSGKHRGYGFVDFDTEEAVSAALKLDRTEIRGRQILVEVAQPKTRNSRGESDSHTFF